MTAPQRAGWKANEVAAMFGVHVDKVYERINAGTIPAEMFGTTYRIPNAWVQERRGLDLSDQDLDLLLQRAVIRALNDLLTTVALVVQKAGAELGAGRRVA